MSISRRNSIPQLRRQQADTGGGGMPTPPSHSPGPRGSIPPPLSQSRDRRSRQRGPKNVRSPSWRDHRSRLFGWRDHRSRLFGWRDRRSRLFGWRDHRSRLFGWRDRRSRLYDSTQPPANTRLTANSTYRDRGTRFQRAITEEARWKRAPHWARHRPIPPFCAESRFGLQWISSRKGISGIFAALPGELLLGWDSRAMWE